MESGGEWANALSGTNPSCCSPNAALRVADVAYVAGIAPYVAWIVADVARIVASIVLMLLELLLMLLMSVGLLLKLL